MPKDGPGELGKEAFDEVEPRSVLRREGKLETAVQLGGKPGFGLLGDVRRMIVEDKFDRRLCRVGGVKELKKFDEFAAPVLILDQSVNLAGDQVNSGQQAHRAMALVFVIARKTRVG